MNTKSVSKKLEEKYGELSVGEVIRAFRLADEISQKEFAKFLGISAQSLNDLEQGRRVPSPKRASNIAKKIGLPEKLLIQLALRDSLRADGLKYKVRIESA